MTIHPSMLCPLREAVLQTAGMPRHVLQTEGQGSLSTRFSVLPHPSPGVSARWARCRTAAMTCGKLFAKSIKFFIILLNRLMGKPIREAP